MKNKLLKIIKHYGLEKQLKYIHSEYFELDEAIMSYQHNGCLESTIDSILTIVLPLTGKKHVDYKKEHIAEEIADVMVMLKQFQYYYEIDDKKIIDIMKKKIDRQLERIEDEIKCTN